MLEKVHSESNEMEAYLFVHFAHGNSEEAEQIYFSVSIDGMRWKALNNSRPILRSTLGEKVFVILILYVQLKAISFI